MYYNNDMYHCNIEQKERKMLYRDIVRKLFKDKKTAMWQRLKKIICEDYIIT